MTTPPPPPPESPKPMVKTGVVQDEAWKATNAATPKTAGRPPTGDDPVSHLIDGRRTS